MVSSKIKKQRKITFMNIIALLEELVDTLLTAEEDFLNYAHRSPENQGDGIG